MVLKSIGEDSICEPSASEKARYVALGENQMRRKLEKTPLCGNLIRI